MITHEYEIGSETPEGAPKTQDDYNLDLYHDLGIVAPGVSDELSFEEKMKIAWAELKENQAKSADLLERIEQLTTFPPANNPQEMTPSEENLKALIEQGFQKLEASIATIKEANQKTSPCVCPKVNLQSVKQDAPKKL